MGECNPIVTYQVWSLYLFEHAFILIIPILILLAKAFSFMHVPYYFYFKAITKS